MKDTGVSISQQNIELDTETVRLENMIIMKQQKQ